MARLGLPPLFSMLGLALLLNGASWASAQAQRPGSVFVVTNTYDNGPGSLRQAIADANTHPGSNSIIITTTGVIFLTSGTMTVTAPVSIVGPGAENLALDGQGVTQVLFSTSDLSLSGLTIQYGHSGIGGGALEALGDITLKVVNIISNTGGSPGGVFAARNAWVTGGRFAGNQSMDYGGIGGGLYVGYDLHMSNTAFVGNHSATGGGASVRQTAAIVGGWFRDNSCTIAFCEGGGLRVTDALFLTDTTFIGNSALGEGGAIFVEGNGGSSRVVNAVIARNSSQGQGAAMYLLSPFGFGGEATILQTTIASPTTGLGSAIYVATGTVSISDTIVASYSVGIVQAGGATVTQDYNLFFNTQPTSGTVGGGAHSTLGDPAFASPPVDDYDLTPSSAAIDKGVDVAVTADIRGFARPHGAAVDIGAYEWIALLNKLFLPLIRH